MNEEYFLSAYLHINPFYHLYNMSKRHDQNVSLWKKCGDNVELVHFWELERISGEKHHKTALYDIDQAKQIINDLLQRYNLCCDDLVQIWGTPGLGTERFPTIIKDLPDYACHAVYHLFSALLMDTGLFNTENILCLAVDGGPDTVLDKEVLSRHPYAGCLSKQGVIEYFPILSPGLLWSYAAYHFRLREGTLMALAYACSCEEITDSIDDDFNAMSAVLGKKYHDYLNIAADTAKKIIKRITDYTLVDGGKHFLDFDSRFSERENKISMIMKQIQKLSIRIMENNVEQIIEKTAMNPQECYLAVSGGFALNCPTNMYLLKRYGFKGFIAPPCVNDSGISLGIALYSFHKRYPGFRFRLEHAYYGDNDDNLEQVTGGMFGKYIKSVSGFEPETAVEDICYAPVVWFDSRAEIGPRALGNRSILADPRSEYAKVQLNKIKQRQWWRPVAPIVLNEYAADWFPDAIDSPFMLLTFIIENGKTKDIPAVAHLDKTARVQSVRSGAKNEYLHQMLTHFHQRTGVPMLCNTSLNDRGEPIINSIAEALNFALRKNIKVIYINGKRIELHAHGEYPEKTPLKRSDKFRMRIPDNVKKSLIEKHNPENLQPDEIKRFLALADAMPFDYE